MVRIAVLGMGYLGTTHAACMTELGHDVLGLDVDSAKLEMLARGEVPFFEPGLEKMLQQSLGSGRLRFSTSYNDAADFAEVFFITVGTPQRIGEYGADLQFVDDAVAALAPLLTRPVVIVGKSTVPVGTAARLADSVRELSPAPSDVEVAWNPEFLREGSAVHDTLHPDRIVLGVNPTREGRAETVIREVYAELLRSNVPIIVTNLETAELVKSAANAFLATKISFINAIADVCQAANADVSVLADAVGHDKRIGRHFLNAGLGFGGGCLPKDIRSLMARANELGANHAFTFLQEVDSINSSRRTQMVEMARTACGGSLPGANVAVLGAAFKPNSDDVRDSPALNVAALVQLQGATVTVFDPKAIPNSRMLFPALNYADTPLDACRQADVVLVLTEWEEFRGLDPLGLRAVVRNAAVIDGRNCLDASTWVAAGWDYRGFGRRTEVSKD